MITAQAGRDEGGNEYSIEANSLSLHVGAPLGARSEIFFGAELVDGSGSMSDWMLLAVPGTPTVEPIDPDWHVVPELSDVDVRRVDYTLGTRYRTPKGWGFEVVGRATRYTDSDPILEDETGRYYSLTTLLSKSF